MNLTLSLFFVFLSEPMSMEKPIPISVANLELSRHFFLLCNQDDEACDKRGESGLLTLALSLFIRLRVSLGPFWFSVSRIRRELKQQAGASAALLMQ